MGLSVGAAGRFDSFKAFSLSRFAQKHLFVIENKIEGENGELPSLFALGGSFPFSTIETFSVERDNANTYYPSLTDIRELEVEFYETMDNKVWDYFDNWRSRLYYNEDEGTIYNVPSVFKRNLYVFRLDSIPKEGQTEFPRVFGYAYRGCFPKHISDYPFTGTESGAVNLSIGFSTDGVRRLKTGQGVESPTILDRASLSTDSSRLDITVTEPIRTEIPSDNPIEGVVVEGRGRQQELAEAETKWRDYQTKMEVDSARIRGERMTRWSTERIVAWVGVLMRSAARIGINIVEREAYYMAYAAMNSEREKRLFGTTMGGVRKATDFIRS